MQGGHLNAYYLRDLAMIRARNQFCGKIKSVKFGNIMAEVIVDVGSVELVSVITKESAESLGMEVTAIVKSKEVMVATGT
jgi:molybdopterin-binding protein